MPHCLLICACACVQQRDHDEFVVRLKDVLPSKQQLLQDLQDNAAQHFDLQVRCRKPVGRRLLPCHGLCHGL